MIRVLIADDHELVRLGLARLLGDIEDICLVGMADGGREAVSLAADTRPDVVLMDLSMPDLDGVDAIREITANSPDSRIVALTSFSDRERVHGALDAGAIGYLLKDCEPDELRRAIRAAARGESPLAPKAAQQLIAKHRSATPVDQLADRDREILMLLAKGDSNKIIARRLEISEHIVKSHVTCIFDALNVTDRTQAAVWAQRHGVDRLA